MSRSYCKGRVKKMSPNRSNHQENLYCEHFHTAAVIFPKESFSIHECWLVLITLQFYESQIECCADCGSDETTLKIDLKAFFTLFHVFIFVEKISKEQAGHQTPSNKGASQDMSALCFNSQVSQASPVWEAGEGGWATHGSKRSQSTYNQYHEKFCIFLFSLSLT